MSEKRNTWQKQVIYSVIKEAQDSSYSPEPDR